MLRKNLRVVSSYLLGIISSIFLSLCLGMVWDFSRVLFSSMTGIIAIYLMYIELWKNGKSDKLNHTVSLKRPFSVTACYLLISILLEVFVAVCKILNMSSALWYFLFAGMVWEYPFTGFYTDSSFLVSTPIITAVVMAFCIFAYYMGTLGISFLENFSAWRAFKNKKAKERHEAEIEKIKEQYRKM